MTTSVSVKKLPSVSTNLELIGLLQDTKIFGPACGQIEICFSIGR